MHSFSKSLWCISLLTRQVLAYQRQRAELRGRLLLTGIGHSITLSCERHISSKGNENLNLTCQCGACRTTSVAEGFKGG